MDNRNKVFLLVLVLQLAVVGYLYRPGSGQVSPPVVNIYDHLQLADVSEFIVTDGTDNDHLKIFRAGQHAWQLNLSDAQSPYPADRNKVETFLSKILGLQSTRLVTRTKSSHDRLQVARDHFNRSVQLKFADGGQRTIYFGTSPNYKATHVRDSEHDDVYLVRDISAWEASTDTSSWWEKRYVNVDLQDISQLKINNLNGSFVLKNISGNWQFATPPSAPFSADSLTPDKIADMIDAVSHITLQDIVSDKQKIPSFAPAVSITITTTDKKTLSIDFWAVTNDSKDIIVKSSDSIFYVIDSFSDIGSFVTFPRNF